MNPKLYWIDSPWKGKLAISARPRGGDWLEDEVKGWRLAGIDGVVSLLTSEELGELGLTEESRLCQAASIRFFSLPIPDRGVPSAQAPVATVLRNVQEMLENGRNVAIHCRQSIGRAGMISAALLTAKGVSPSEALHRASAARGLDVPETEEQKSWVMQLAVAGV